ncbi:galactose-1-phosphate uridylyltransferase [candidate division WOR-1 bacterium RIFCSPHIGHO2_01_FULL_53_15]|uniref:Galactose-1-phosphate uridylyltransferase n=1 Tax=candidate division WOR-1 bacterium RIFCSPHIGHO2_01_FULL_53_15 TaxID=1802564 RepID=A0A1F4Q1P9_UNCSA|nr:MAG: galactose-1-phosphate uridylyltransferase [candidate division WOR-1 bacterium RIFCSPHIGHO2_01_FULL_53_15]OGC13089.1 MAG: galactose-1-phosphate uridylyltransferase [candidate division WOR-1 bacterium RIFCSPHIGHO2_02_FULL_53_26]
MPELRQNPATKEWVIIATERAKRPEEMGLGVANPPANEKERCPFCAGHERSTPNEIFSFRSFGTAPNTPGWWIRVIPNKFAALLPQGSPDRVELEGLFHYMNGVGEHEVLIESPEHTLTIATMPEKQVEEIFLAYRERYIALSQDPRFEMVIIFKNHGLAAGTSLRHPHSQIIAAPITPNHIRHRIEEAMRYFDDHGHCVYCDMIQKEKKLGDRIVAETENFIVLEPFASRSPFETMVIPKSHASTFDAIAPERCKELAYVMRLTLKKIYRSLNNPDYNYVIVSSPSHERSLEYYHWYIMILPRVTAVAGFELGSGIYINTVIPESAAKFLRETPFE